MTVIEKLLNCKLISTWSFWESVYHNIHPSFTQYIAKDGKGQQSWKGCNGIAGILFLSSKELRKHF